MCVCKKSGTYRTDYFFFLSACHMSHLVFDIFFFPTRIYERQLDNIQMENVNYYSILLFFLFTFIHTNTHTAEIAKLKKSINWQTFFSVAVSRSAVTKDVDYALKHSLSCFLRCRPVVEVKLTKKHSIFRRTCSYAIIPKHL